MDSKDVLAATLREPHRSELEEVLTVLWLIAGILALESSHLLGRWIIAPLCIFHSVTCFLASIGAAWVQLKSRRKS